MEDMPSEVISLLEEWVRGNPGKRAVLISAIDLEGKKTSNAMMGEERNAILAVTIGTDSADAAGIHWLYKTIGIKLLNTDGELTALAKAVLEKEDKTKKTTNKRFS